MSLDRLTSRPRRTLSSSIEAGLGIAYLSFDPWTRRSATQILLMFLEAVVVVLCGAVFGAALGLISAAASFLVVFLSVFGLMQSRTRELGIQRAVGATRLELVFATQFELMAMWVIVATVSFAVLWPAAHLAAQAGMLELDSTWRWMVVALTTVIAGSLLGSCVLLARIATAPPVAWLRRR